MSRCELNRNCHFARRNAESMRLVAKLCTLRYSAISHSFSKGMRGMPKRAWQTSLVLLMCAISKSLSGECFKNQGKFRAVRVDIFATIPVGDAW